MEGEIYFSHRQWWFVAKIDGMHENFRIAPFYADLVISSYFPWNTLNNIKYTIIRFWNNII